DIADEAVAVELRTAQLHLDRVGRAMKLLRRAEDLADEAVGDHDVVADGETKHGATPLFGEIDRAAAADKPTRRRRRRRAIFAIRISPGDRARRRDRRRAAPCCA